MSAFEKIQNGLREALSYARGECRHEYTVWAPNRIPAGCSDTISWSRVCTLCKCRETTFVEPMPHVCHPATTHLEWTLSATDTPTERARKITEIAWAGMFPNRTMVDNRERAIPKVAEALEKYRMADGAAAKSENS